MAWVVNSLPQPSCPAEGQLSWALVQAGLWFRVGWAVKAWLVREGGLLCLQSSFLHSGSTCRDRPSSPSRSWGR